MTSRQTSQTLMTSACSKSPEHRCEGCTAMHRDFLQGSVQVGESSATTIRVVRPAAANRTDPNSV